MAAGCFSRIKISSVLFLSFLFLGFSEASVYLVGGKYDAWRTPSDEVDFLNRWSEKSRFIIVDYLVFEYDGSKDSVLLVTKEDYLACNSSSPLKSYSGGNTMVKLERSGPYYFISGQEGSCMTGRKVIVVVVSDMNSPSFDGSPYAAPEDGMDMDMDMDTETMPTISGGMLNGGLVVVFVAALVGGAFVG